jgi:hypothetical protein
VKASPVEGKKNRVESVNDLDLVIEASEGTKGVKETEDMGVKETEGRETGDMGNEGEGPDQDLVNWKEIKDSENPSSSWPCSIFSEATVC